MCGKGDIERCSLGVGRAHVFRLPFFHDFPAEDAFIPETVDVILCPLGEIVCQQSADVNHHTLVLHARYHFQHQCGKKA